MKIKTLVPIMLIAFTSLSGYSQSNEINILLQDFETKATAGTPRSPEEAEPVLERVAEDKKEDVVQALPSVFSATTSPHVSVRRVAVSFLFAIVLRPDGYALLSEHTDIFAATLVDPDIPIRRMTGLIFQSLRLGPTSPLVANLREFLSREDAVTTIGGGVAGLLMQADPHSDATTAAVLQFMNRKDHTQESRADVLQSVRVARTQNREIGKAVASYADRPDNITSRQALETLQGMGKAVLSDNQALLLKVAADDSRDPSVRAAARQALSVLP